MLIFAALITWCTLLVAARVWRSHSLMHVFLLWNLFLAAVPAIAAIFFMRAKSTIARSIWFVVWLLFLPNAPYIVTDFIHLAVYPRIPMWFDIALLASFAGTGLLLCYSSVDDVRATLAQRFGSATSWTIAIAALLLSGFGIYLGRFARLNSWDALTDPLDLARYISHGAVHPFAHPKTIAVTVIYGVGLVLGYFAYQLPRLRTNMQSP